MIVFGSKTITSAYRPSCSVPRSRIESRLATHLTDVGEHGQKQWRLAIRRAGQLNRRAASVTALLNASSVGSYIRRKAPDTRGPAPATVPA